MNPRARDAPGGIRTPDLLVRSQALYPAELRALTATPTCILRPGAAKSAHDRTRTCTPFPTLVPQTSLSTNSSTWATTFHVPSIPHTKSCSGRDSNPHEVNPHRVLNPARLPIPPPERVRAQNTLSGCTSGAEGNRTPDLLNAIQALSQLSYGPRTHDLEADTLTPPADFVCQSTRAGLTRLELATSGVTDRHSNQLSYSPHVSYWSCVLHTPRRGIEPRSPP